MTIATDLICTRFRFLSMAVFAVAILSTTLLPASADAQDFEAVEQRLAKAVRHGEIDLLQAAMMMETLHEMSEEHEEMPEWHEHEYEGDHMKGGRDDERWEKERGENRDEERMENARRDNGQKENSERNR